LIASAVSAPLKTLDCPILHPSRWLMVNAPLLALESALDCDYA
jgi:hypothetical protein